MIDTHLKYDSLPSPISKWIKTLITSIVLSLSVHGMFAQQSDSLRTQIEAIIASKKARVGVSILGVDGKEKISVHGDLHCPLQSVFKLHIAILVLSEIDQGKFSLKQKIEIQKDQLLPDLWSPLREKHPEGGRFTIARLIDYAITQSDNVACDALLRLIGGPEKVEAYFIQKGIQDIGIKLNEERMQAQRDSMILNWTTPDAASKTLQIFYTNTNSELSSKSHAFLWKTMKKTKTGLKRIKGQLPKGTTVAHKTGSSGTSKAGITEATNDIGILFLPDGRHFFLSIFVTQSFENEETNEKLIADIAKVTWDYYDQQ